MRKLLDVRAAGLVVTVLVAAMAAGAFIAMRSTNLVGDEHTYTAMAASIARWLSGREAGGQALDEVIGTGWFMPGMGMLGTPAYLLFDNPPFWLVHLVALVPNLALLALLAWLANRSWGHWHGLALLVFPGLAFGWHLSATGWYPEIPAGLLSAIALVACWRMGMAVVNAGTVSLRQLLAFELALLAGLYLRGPVLPLAAGLHAILFVLLFSRHALAMRNALRLAAGLALLFALLAPWSMAVSARFDQPVLTTTNVPLVLADGFAGPEKSCFGPCAPGDDIWPAWQFSQDMAARTGENPLDVQRRMMDHALADLTPATYFARVRENFGRLLFDPMQRLPTYRRFMYGVPEGLRDPFIAFASAITLVVYVPFLLALLAANLLPFRRNDNLRMQSILLKGATACAFLQPFVHKSSARYWMGFAPLMAWAAALLLVAWLSRQQGREASGMPGWIDWAQRGYGAGFLALGLLIAVGLPGG